MVAPLSLCVTTVRLKQRQWTMSHARRRAECRQRSRQYTDNKLQNRFPSLPFHRLNIKDSIHFFWHGWPRIFDQGPLGIPKGDAC